MSKTKTLLITHFLVILLLSFGNITIVMSQCPNLQPPCRCASSIYEPIAIICENAGSLGNALKAIESAKNIPIDSLLILDTAVSTLPENAFQSFTILRLVINRNTLNKINENAFNGSLIDSLIELDLSDNQLGEISSNGINKLRNLRKLYFNRNRITTLTPNIFEQFQSREILLKLELSGNRLSDEIFHDSKIFRPLKNLQQLSLETNALTKIPSTALINQRETLTNLNLGLNQINDVPVGALNFPILTSLSLEFNGISVIIPQAFQGVPNLQYLFLTGNKFPSWQPEMFRYIKQLRTLGIGETPISVIPSNAFIHTPNLIRLEMSEAAVDAIENGAFQKTPLLQAIILNKNRLSVIRQDLFQGLNDLYSIDLQGNRIDTVEAFGFANLPGLRHLDISYNQLQTMPFNTFNNSFEPIPNDRRVIFACANPWLCDSRLEWFRQILRDNLDIDIDKPECVATCISSINGCPPEGTPLRSNDFCPIFDDSQLQVPLSSGALSFVGWIILAVILTILLISICLLALIRYGMSHRNKKMKENVGGDDQHRIVSSAASVYQASIFDQSHSVGNIGLNLPAAHTLENQPNYFM